MPPDTLAVVQIIIIVSAMLVVVVLGALTNRAQSSSSRRFFAELSRLATERGVTLEPNSSARALRGHRLVEGTRVFVGTETEHVPMSKGNGTRSIERGLVTPEDLCRWADFVLLTNVPPMFGLGYLTRLPLPAWSSKTGFAANPAQASAALSPGVLRLIEGVKGIDSVVVHSGRLTIKTQFPLHAPGDIVAVTELAMLVHGGRLSTIAPRTLTPPPIGLHSIVIALVFSLLIAAPVALAAPFLEVVDSNMSVLVCEYSQDADIYMRPKGRGRSDLAVLCHSRKRGYYDGSTLGYFALSAIFGTAAMLIGFIVIATLLALRSPNPEDAARRLG